MRICIFGAGAIGGYLAVKMREAGLDVSVIARGTHLKAMQDKGLTLRTKDSETTVRLTATNDAASLGPQDYVIVALKAHQAWESVDQMRPLLGPKTVVVTAQNGLPWWYFYGLDAKFADLRLSSVDPGHRQWEGIGPQRVIGATVYPATEIEEPGLIRHIYGDQFGLGEPNRQPSERLEKLAEAFTASGLKPRIYDDIRDDIWIKLWGNLCFNPISALTHATLDVIATDPGTRSIARAMMLEAETIGRHFGANFRVDVERRIQGAASVGAHRTSMLQDLDKSRPLRSMPS